MFVITVRVEPKPGTDLAEEAGGAFAVCWIDFALQDGAEHLAKFYIEQAGWTPLEVKSVAWADEEYYDEQYEGEERDQLKQYYSEAEADGVSIVFHEWPVDAEDRHEDPGEW